MGRYSSIPDTIRRAGQEVPNPAKEAEGVRRFKRGLRTEKGECDGELKQHMSYHLQEEKDLTWKKALDVAGRWEMAANKGSESNSEKSSESEVEVEAVSSETGARSKEKTKEKVMAISAVEKGSTLMEHERSIAEVKMDVATLVDQVKTNTMDLKCVKTEQERFSFNMDRVMESLVAGFEDMSMRFDDMQNNIQQLQVQQQMLVEVVEQHPDERYQPQQ